MFHLQLVMRLINRLILGVAVNLQTFTIQLLKICSIIFVNIYVFTFLVFDKLH